MLKLALKLAVSATLLAVLIANIDLAAIRGAIWNADLKLVAGATLLLVGLVPFLAWRWVGIARTVGMPLSLRSALVVVLVGTFFNQVLPSAIGGDAIRVWLLRNEPVPLGKIVSSVLLDRVVSLVGMIAVVIVGAPALLEVVRLPEARAGAVLAIACGFGGIGVLLCLDMLPAVPVPIVGSVLARISVVASDARRVFLSVRALGASVSLSVLIHLLASLSVWLLSRSIGLDVDIVMFIVLLPVVLILSLLPISLAGWGVREGAMVACLGLVGVEPAPAFAVSALFGLASILAGLPGGVAWLLLGGRSAGGSRPGQKA